MQKIFKTYCTLRENGFSASLGIISYFIWATAVPLQTCGQQPPPLEIDIDKTIQALLPVTTEDVDFTDLYETLLQLHTHPLDLNTATRDELSALYILSDTHIKAFLDYRAKLGPLLSLYELQAVPEFDLATIYQLLPFVTVQSRALPLREALKSPTQHFLMLRTSRLLEQQKGFSATDSLSRSLTRYQGNSLYAYLRYRYAQSGSYSLGISFEKDAGEKWWQWAPKRHIFGADFTSFHAQILNRGRFKNIIIGDFQLQAGQGLVFAAGFSLGKGTEVIRAAYRSTLGLKPYTSSIEANYFRGVAATYRIAKQISITTFYSQTRRDASMDESTDTSDELLVSSLLLSGYHRTPAERQKQGIIPERNVGFHALYKTDAQAGQVGVTVLYTDYGYSLQKKDVPYNRFEFTGKKNLVTGLHGDYRWKNFLFFGEAARSLNGGLGGIGGLITGLGKKLDFTMLVRYYAKDFHTLYGNAIAEATRPINEAGSYWGLRYVPNRQWQLSGYYDFFKFPWLKFQINAPSTGHDFLFHLLYKPNKRFNAYSLFHEKHKSRNRTEAQLPMPPVEQTIKRTLAINLEYDVPLKYAVRLRLQYGDFAYENGATSKGVAAVQDVTWRKKKIELSGRLAFFSTNNYESRQYVYEKDVLYAFSIPAYYDTGTRHYLMVRYNWNKNMKIWLRWSQTRYAKLELISSGLNEIAGNKRSEVKMQLWYQF
jgi:hypothetical protein